MPASLDLLLHSLIAARQLCASSSLSKLNCLFQEYFSLDSAMKPSMDMYAHEALFTRVLAQRRQIWEAEHPEIPEHARELLWTQDLARMSSRDHHTTYMQQSPSNGGLNTMQRSHTQPQGPSHKRRRLVYYALGLAKSLSPDD